MSSEGAPPPSVDPAPVNPPPADVSPPPPPPPPTEPQAVAAAAAAAVIGAPPPPPPPRKVARKSAAAAEKSVLESMDERVLIGVAAGAGLLVLFIVGLICCACRNSKKKKNKKMKHGGHGHGQDQVQYYYVNVTPNGAQYSPSSQPDKNWNPDHQALHIPITHNTDTSSNLSSPQQLPNQGTFAYDELAAATSGFSKANLLGQGGFGYVHKGVLPNGREIAVKSLKAGSGQGEREFQAEVEIISRVHHRHLVSLVGYCIAGGRRMLVYEYVPNNNLEFHLHGKGRPPLEWAKRLKIAKGSARGLAYLHEDCQPRIIHRDIKTANILVDYNFDAQVADFGLAKLTSENQTHVSTRIMGTFGYLAPEYACSGQLTEKSDVYSFGIMLLELITGRPPMDFTGEMEESLVDWARPLLLRALDDGNYDEFIDPRLHNNFDPREMRRMIACAAASVRHSARKRPKMSQIVRVLEGDVSLDDLHNGVKPGQSTTFGRHKDDMTEMRKFMKLALDTTDDSG